MITEMKIGHEAGQDVRRETSRLLKEKGPSLDRTLLRLRQALNAKDTRVVKLKGAVSEEAMPKGFGLVVTTGAVVRGEDGMMAYGDGDSLIKYDVVAHGPRLKAIELALTLHDAMPSQRHDHNIHADPELVNAVIDGLPGEVVGSVLSKLDKYISGKRPRTGAKK